MDERSAGILGGVVGLPADLAGPPADLDPVRLGQVTNELLVDWVKRIASASPTLLLIDDVPNADPSSLAVLAQITTAPPPHLLALFTARSDSVLPGFLRSGGVRRVELNPLADEPAALLVDRIEVELDDARRRQVLALGEGVPLYLEELARGAHQTTRAGLLPITLTQRLQVRLNEPRIDREIAGVLAVAGQQVDEELVAAVLGVSIDELRQRLEGLLAADLVVRPDRPRPVSASVMGSSLMPRTRPCWRRSGRGGITGSPRRCSGRITTAGSSLGVWSDATCCARSTTRRVRGDPGERGPSPSYGREYRGHYRVHERPRHRARGR
jgi:hypothetical protein